MEPCSVMIALVLFDSFPLFTFFPYIGMALSPLFVRVISFDCVGAYNVD